MPRRVLINPGADFLLKLEQSVHQMHQHGIVQPDIRCMRNSVVSYTGDPLLLVFQTELFLYRISRFMHQFLNNIDISVAYSCWKRASEKTIDPERLAFLSKMEKKRPLWVF